MRKASHNPEVGAAEQRFAIPEFRGLVTRVMGVLAAGAVLFPSTTLGNDRTPLPDIPSPAECPLTYLQGPSTVCQADLPPKCLTPIAQQQLQHFDYEPAKRQKAKRIVDQVLTDAQPLQGAMTDKHLELSAEDNSAVLYNDQGRRQAVLALGRVMGATWWRFNLDPIKFRHKADYKAYQIAVQDALNCGYNIQTTIGGRGQNWAPRVFAKHVSYIVGLTPPGQVKRVSLYNEPNGGVRWLKPLPNRTPAQTYRLMFQAGSAAARQTDPSIEVDGFDLSSKDYPLVFMDEALRCLPDEKPCKPLVMDHVNYHAYKFTKSPLDDPLTTSWKVEQVGIDALNVVEDRVHQAFEEKEIVTPQGNQPQLNINEFGYRNNLLPPGQRAMFYPRAEVKACGNPSISGLSMYHIDSMPKGWEGTWDSSQANSKGNLRMSFYVMQEAAFRLPCIEG